ncbi:hypothetical protein LOAG_14523, partial [Loa loa]
GFCARYSLPKKAAAQVRRIVARGEETAGEKVYECILIERILNHEIEVANSILHARKFRMQGSCMQRDSGFKDLACKKVHWSLKIDPRDVGQHSKKK